MLLCSYHALESNSQALVTDSLERILRDINGVATVIIAVLTYRWPGPTIRMLFCSGLDLANRCLPLKMRRFQGDWLSESQCLDNLLSVDLVFQSVWEVSTMYR